MSQILDQAIQGEDILLVDRIAWMQETAPAVKRARDWIEQLYADYMKQYQYRQITGQVVTVQAPCIIHGFAKVAAPRQPQIPPFRVVGDLPKHVSVALGDVESGNFTVCDVDYGIVLDEGAGEQSVNASFKIVADESRDADVSLTIKTTTRTLTDKDILRFYACAAYCQRRANSQTSPESAIKLLKEAVEAEDWKLVEIIQPAIQRRLRSAAFQGDATLPFKQMLGVLSRSREDTTRRTALMLQRVINDKWPEWQKKTDEGKTEPGQQPPERDK